MMGIMNSPVTPISKSLTHGRSEQNDKYKNSEVLHFGFVAIFHYAQRIYTLSSYCSSIQQLYNVGIAALILTNNTT